MDLEQYLVNGKPVWRGRVQKIGGIVIGKNEQPHFVVRSLTTKDATAMSDLSSVIYSHLNKGEECFIHKHDKNYYNQIFNNKDVVYIGVFVGANIVGMSYIYLCDNEQKLNNEIPNSPINFFEKNPNMKAVSLGADCVHPDYRGNNFNQIMIQYRLDLAKKMGCSDAFSIIDRNNHWNMSPYFNNGFQMFAGATDPSDGGKIALMHNDIKEQKEVKALGLSVAYDNFSHIDTLLAKGFVGNSYNQKNKTINFVKKVEERKLNKVSAIFFVNSVKRGCNV